MNELQCSCTTWSFTAWNSVRDISWRCAPRSIELGAVYRRRKLEPNASLGVRACRRDVFCRCAPSDGNQQASSTTHCPQQWPPPARWLSTSAVARGACWTGQCSAINLAACRDFVLSQSGDTGVALCQGESRMISTGRHNSWRSCGCSGYCLFQTSLEGNSPFTLKEEYLGPKDRDAT